MLKAKLKCLEKLISSFLIISFCDFWTSFILLGVIVGRLSNILKSCIHFLKSDHFCRHLVIIIKKQKRKLQFFALICWFGLPCITFIFIWNHVYAFWPQYHFSITTIFINHQPYEHLSNQLQLTMFSIIINFQFVCELKTFYKYVFEGFCTWLVLFSFLTFSAEIIHVLSSK